MPDSSTNPQIFSGRDPVAPSTLVYWLALTHVPGLGGATTRRLLERFGSLEAIFGAEPEALARIPRLRTEAIAALRTVSWVDLKQELAALARAGVALLTWEHPAYPRALQDLSDPPPVFFLRGDLLREDEPAVAIIGSRQASERSLKAAFDLARGMATAGLTVVSGLALGIDTAAHQGALAAPDGRTIAVLGSGIANVHPRQNADLAARIATRGALLSEVRPDAPPQGATLMARDRIIGALGRGVIVVEAGEKSGSLDTARRAQRLGRPVFACPGSPGTETLLKGGAEAIDATEIDGEVWAARLRPSQPGQPAAIQPPLF